MDETRRVSRRRSQRRIGAPSDFQSRLALRIGGSFNRTRNILRSKDLSYIPKQDSHRFLTVAREFCGRVRTVARATQGRWNWALQQVRDAMIFWAARVMDAGHAM